MVRFKTKFLICSQYPPIFSIICDGTRDISGEEQLSVCFRWVDKDLRPHDSFVDLYSVRKTTGEHIASVLLDVMIKLQLPISNFRGQAYDGAPDMSGKNNGVQAMFSNHQLLALYVHCVIRDTCNSSITVKNSLDLAHKLGVLLSQSLHAKNSLVHLLELRAGGPVGNIAKLKPLCPTRWIYRGNQITEIIEHYEEILATLEDLKSHDKAAGLLRVFEVSSTFLGVLMANYLILKLELLNRSLQGTKQTSSGLIDAVNLIYSDLNNSINEDAFKKIFQEATRKS
ncbi:hypothetical protein PR048_023083 [Dryococelus australis]|uniref:DUF4371 domain-containing protein n=1 Tax=Dryococelus australis TaxID=614101 RepID=A0ABQ9GT36_9NEOP|nr:hypothetical protein PR048_023083 [Dryococelus australis]